MGTSRKPNNVLRVYTNILTINGIFTPLSYSSTEPSTNTSRTIGSAIFYIKKHAEDSLIILLSFLS